jgi:hypothetical protein
MTRIAKLKSAWQFAWRYVADDYREMRYVCHYEGGGRVRAAWWLLSCYVRSLTCRFFGHDMDLVDSWCGPDSAGETFGCQRCGHEEPGICF